MTRLQLIAPASEVRFVGPMAMPAELYFLARQPVALAGMAYPSRVDWTALHDEGLRRVVCLTHDEAPYDPAPLAMTAIALQDLYTGVIPDDPEAEVARIVRAATVVVESLAAGEGVAVHCRGGRGRAGTVLGSALVMLGHDADVVINHLDRIHTIRGKGGWPESAWQAETVRKFGSV
jgi:Swiss Army Knife protein, DSP-PTPase phosphatase domain